MIGTPHITRTHAQPAAVIHLTIPREEIQHAMGPAFGELMATLTAQGVTPAGPFFSRHFRMDPATYDFEVGVPVSAAVTAAGRVKPGELPGAKVVQTTYHGGYDGLGEGWGELDRWIEGEGLQTGEELWERYVTGPESGDDPAGFRTELNRPLMG